MKLTAQQQYAELSRMWRAIDCAEQRDLETLLNILVGYGVPYVAAHRLCCYVCELQKRNAPKKRGRRGSGYLPYWIDRVKTVKAELNAAGTHNGAQEQAIDIVEHEHVAWQRKWLSIGEEEGEPRHPLPDFDALAVYNALRRSQRPRRSRA